MGYMRDCVSCGCKWGDGQNVGSSGICPTCFKEWINRKRKDNGLRACYGEFGTHNDVDCSTCTVTKLCFKDMYEIK